MNLQDTVALIAAHPQLDRDARVAASGNDYAGLCGIANVANGLPISGKIKFGFLFDLADLIRGNVTLVAAKAGIAAPAAPALTQDQLFVFSQTLQSCGGSFARSFGETLSKADSGNTARLLAAFPDLVERFGPASHWYAETDAALTPSPAPRTAVQRAIALVVENLSTNDRLYVPGDADDDEAKFSAEPKPRT